MKAWMFNKFIHHGPLGHNEFKGSRLRHTIQGRPQPLMLLALRTAGRAHVSQLRTSGPRLSKKEGGPLSWPSPHSPLKEPLKPSSTLIICSTAIYKQLLRKRPSSETRALVLHCYIGGSCSGNSCSSMLGLQVLAA